jgi:hypothetical protein
VQVRDNLTHSQRVAAYSGVIAGPIERPDWPVPVTKNDRIRSPTEVCDVPDDHILGTDSVADWAA